MENKTNSTTADEQKKQTTPHDHLNNNPGGTSMGGGQSDQHDKLNYGAEGCDTCKEDFDKNIDSMVGQVENHGQKEHNEQEHEVNDAFGKSGKENEKPFDSREERSKQSGIHNETDKTGKSGVYGQQQGNSEWNKNGQTGQNEWNKSGQTGQQGQNEWNKSGSTYGQGQGTQKENNFGKSEHSTDYKKENDKEIK